MPSKLDLIFSDWNNGDIKVETKYPIYLLIDTSASMNNFDGKNVPKIEEINIFLKEFFEFIRNDARAAKLSEISIISFGDKVKIVEEFKSIYYINAPHFTANGNKFLYEAMNLVMKLIDIRKKYYLEEKIEYNKPYVLLFSDGKIEQIDEIVLKRVQAKSSKYEFKMITIGVGDNFDEQILSKYSYPLTAKRLMYETVDRFIEYIFCDIDAEHYETDILSKWWEETEEEKIGGENMPNKLDLLFANWNNGDVKIERKVPICLLLDVSGSMCNYDGSNKTKIEEINDNVKTFLEFVKNDPRASKISEICIITFGNVVKVVQDYSDITNINIPKFTAYGGTPLGGAVEKAVELLSKRRQYYRDNNIEHFKPILLLMTDGEPTDDYYASAKNFSERVIKKEFKVFPVGMGKSFNCSILNQFSPLLPPKQISKTEEFEELFNLLSESSRKPEDDPLAKWWNELP